MRLAKLKLAGFKSFVDPTSIGFPSDLVAVVGPNGCGKSNIIDAVRWVMGESSAKHLRGESMADVIFNGSTGRKPVGQAFIELTFDNSDATLQGQYAQYAEIAVKRLVTRDGESQYFLNGTRCRRRDITDLFLGTGLGPRSYAIIEQGMISRLIEAKPEELRLYLEEVAGIARYKERRKETETRIRNTRENLDRLNDLREELTRQLEHLQKQASAAKRYQELKTEQTQLDMQLKAMRFRRLDDDFNGQQRLIQQGEVSYEAEVAKQRQIDLQIEQRRVTHEDGQDVLQQVQSRYYAMGAEIARLEQTLQHQKEREQQLKDEVATLTQQHAVHQAQLTQDEQELQEKQLLLEQLQPQWDVQQERAEQAAQALDDWDETLRTWQENWDTFNEQSAKHNQQVQGQQAQIQHKEENIQKTEQRLLRLQQEQETLATGRDETDILAAEEQLAQIMDTMAEHEHQLTQWQQQLQSQRQQNTQVTQDLAQVRICIEQLKGQQAALNALQQAALTSDDELQQWLKQHELDQLPKLAQQVRVQDDRWAPAVETVLGIYLGSVCVQDSQTFANKVTALLHGDLVLLDKHATTTVLPSQISLPRLMDVVQSQWPLQGILQHVYCADTVDIALQHRSTLAAYESIITAEGVWVGPHWLRFHQSQDATAGILAREQALQQVDIDLEQQQQRLDALLLTQHQGEDAVVQFELSRDEQQENNHRLQREQSVLQAQITAKKSRIEHVSSRQQAIQTEMQELQQQCVLDQQLIKETRAELTDRLETMAMQHQERERLQTKREEQREAWSQAKQQAQREKDSAVQLQLRVQQLQSELAATEKNRLFLSEQLQQTQQRLQDTCLQQERLVSPLETQGAQLESLLDTRLNIEEELQEAKTQVDSIAYQLRQLEQERNQTEQRAQEKRTQLEQLRLNLQTLHVRRMTLEEALQEAQVELETLIASIPEEATETDWEQNLQHIERKIQYLGAINLAAIEEYDTQSERKHYLDSQFDDLTEALATLETAIEKIDKETRQTFKETFDTVNESLKTLFPQMFGGGEAYLELTGEELLDTGVAIMARPPGKRNSTIHLLSGGEKALTAIALVFSLFKLNPAPFCMLDEVDAPLDEANVGRFCKLVKEMSKSVQFIFITHNKVTMEMAEHLIGVTMREPGVSRLVAVGVQEAAEMAGIA